VNKALGHCRLKKDGGAHNQPKNNGEFELRKKKKKKKGKGMLIAKSMQAMMEQAEKTSGFLVVSLVQRLNLLSKAQPYRHLLTGKGKS
jgi:hypothetical protein